MTTAYGLQLLVIGGTLAIAPPMQLMNLLITVTMDLPELELVSLLLLVQTAQLRRAQFLPTLLMADNVRMGFG